MAGGGSSHGYGGVSGKGKARYTVAKWWEKDATGERTRFQSALAGQTLKCPHCDDKVLAAPSARVWACTACDGSFVEHAALVEMVGEMLGEPWQLPAPIGATGTRACPACSELMHVEPVEGVTIDRCQAHGVWFDAHELPELLAASATPDDEARPGGWLRRLFGASKLPEARVIKE